MRLLPIAGVLLLAAPNCGAAASSPETRAYSSSLDELLQAKGRQSIEPVFKKAQTAGKGLLSVIENMDQAAFDALKKGLKGLILYRDETIVAEPDLEFFLDLAKRKGLEPDQAFFALGLKTKPDSLWPDYIEQQTDYSGCTKYGDGAMAGLYGDWAGFRKKFPASYGSQVESERDRIASELTEGTCACGGKESVLAELEGFIKTFPKSPVAEKLKGRVKLIRSGKSDMRFECVSG